MTEEFDILLKTQENTEIHKQTNDDIFKNSKFKIKKLCRALCLPAKDYKPEKTIEAIKRYIAEKSTKERILYSEISSYVYGLTIEDQGNFATNIECLVSYANDEKNGVEETLYKIIVKIYDHFQLAIQQKALNSNVSIDLQKLLAESIDEAKEKLLENVNFDSKKMEQQYISILGIFAAVVLSFVGGLTFSSSVLQNIDAISIYRLLMVVDILALVLINVIYLLIKFICQINDKNFKLFKIKWVNICFIIFGVFIFAAWLLDIQAFSEFVNRYLPWT